MSFNTVNLMNEKYNTDSTKATQMLGIQTNIKISTA